jgi:hypothetical protein
MPLPSVQLFACIADIGETYICELISTPPREGGFQPVRKEKAEVLTS